MLAILVLAYVLFGWRLIGLSPSDGPGGPVSPQMVCVDVEFDGVAWNTVGFSPALVSLHDGTTAPLRSARVPGTGPRVMIDVWVGFGEWGWPWTVYRAVQLRSLLATPGPGTPPPASTESAHTALRQQIALGLPGWSRHATRWTLPAAPADFAVGLIVALLCSSWAADLVGWLRAGGFRGKCKRGYNLLGLAKPICPECGARYPRSHLIPDTAGPIK